MDLLFEVVANMSLGFHFIVVAGGLVSELNIVPCSLVQCCSKRNKSHHSAKKNVANAVLSLKGASPDPKTLNQTPGLGNTAVYSIIFLTPGTQLAVPLR